MSSSTSYKRRRRRPGSGYRSAKLVPVEQAGNLPLGRAEFAAAGAVTVVALTLIALIWIVAGRAASDSRAEMRYRAEQLLTAQASTIAETVSHELLMIDQSLKIIQTAWNQNSDAVDLAKWKADMLALTAVSDDIFISDDKHIIRQDIYPKAVGQAIGSAYINFPHGSLETYQSDGTKDREALMLRGEVGAPIDARQFLMYVIRPLDHPKGWLLGAAYRSTELTKLFARAGLGYNPIVALVELRNGTVQAVVGPAARRPHTEFRTSPLYALMTRNDTGVWTGETSIDGVDRVHAYAHVPGRDLVVLVGSSSRQVMQPADALAAGAHSLAAVGSALVLAIGALVLWELYTTRANRRRQRILERNRKEIDRLRADDELQMARATLNADRLQKVLGSVTDGVALFDASQRLVQWNHPFQRGIGIPLRPDMPLEIMLREQIAAGVLGPVEAPDAEAARRMTVLRDARAEGLAQPGPDGETLMLRGLVVDAGGFMLLLNGLLHWEPPPPPAAVAEPAAPVAEVQPAEPLPPATTPIEW